MWWRLCAELNYKKRLRVACAIDTKLQYVGLQCIFSYNREEKTMIVLLCFCRQKGISYLLIELEKTAADILNEHADQIGQLAKNS